LTDSQLEVELGDRSYPVLFRDGATPELAERIESVATTRRVIVVSDSNVAPLHARPLLEALTGRGVRADLLEMPAGEAHKHLGTLGALYDRCFDVGVDRRTVIVALGGGVVGDVAGLLAATLLRGVPLVQVPTSVLAQVDASVGGKTAVNHAAGKNLIGTFYQPRLVFVDAAPLATLPIREVRCGLAEVVKHGAIADTAILDRVIAQADALQREPPDPETLRSVVEPSVAVKAAVVAEDERESGRRAILNFGHTLGHAIEAEAGYGTLTHGEAVALGMRFAARLSAEHGWLSSDGIRRVDHALDACGLPTDWGAWIRPEVLARLGADKKVRGDAVQFVLLRRLGDAAIVSMSLESLEQRAVAMEERERRRVT
jgi:3-dehydroquinate synthase